MIGTAIELFLIYQGAILGLNLFAAILESFGL